MATSDKNINSVTNFLRQRHKKWSSVTQDIMNETEVGNFQLVGITNRSQNPKRIKSLVTLFQDIIKMMTPLQFIIDCDTEQFKGLN